MNRSIGLFLILGVIDLFAAIPAAPFSSDQYTVALWHFNEGTGDSVYDASGNGNHGQIIGAKWVDGRFGAGLLFSGVDSVRVADKPDLHVQAVTIEAWVYSDNFGTAPHGVIVSKEYGNMASYRLQNYDGVGHVSMVTNNNWGNHITTTDMLSNGTWHYVAGVAANGYLKVYIDGVLAVSAPRTIAMSYDASPLLIGAVRYVANECFRGIIDEVRISSIDRFAASPQGGAADPRLIARYTFEDPDPLTAIDVSDNGHHGIIHEVTKKTSAWGTAACFSGNASSWIEIQDHADFKQTSALTIEAFLTVTGLPVQHGIIFFRGDNAGAGDPWYLCVQPNSAIRFHIESADFSVANLEAPITLNTPLHIVATFNAADRMMKLYINGALAASQMTTVAPMAELPGGAGGGWVSIGNHPYPGEHVFPFAGTIEELSFYNYALDSVAVSKHYHAFDQKQPGRLLAHWSFDSCAGISTLYDVTGHGYDAHTSGSGLSFSSGIRGQALNCSGSGYDAVVANSRDSFMLAKFSIETWFYSNINPSQYPEEGKILDYSYITYGTRNGFTLDVYPSGNIRLVITNPDGSAWVIASSVTKLEATTWYHIACTFDSTILKIYVNGVLDGSFAYAGTYLKPNNEAHIGFQKRSDGSSKYFLNGKIDELKLYNYALPADSIAAHYHEVYPIPPIVRNDSIPVLIPMVPETQTNRKPTFRWHPGAGASSYRIVIDAAGDFANPIIILPLLDTFFTPLVNLPYGKICWKVSAGTNYDRYSAVDTFMVAAMSGSNGSMRQELSATGAVNVMATGQGFKLDYSVRDRVWVTIKLYSLTGTCIATLCNERSNPGIHTLQWNNTDKNSRILPKGSYLMRCMVGSNMSTKKIVLLR